MGTISKLKCRYTDCRHEWYPRTEALPKVCPKCKRYNWQEKFEGEENNEKVDSNPEATH